MAEETKSLDSARDKQEEPKTEAKPSSSGRKCDAKDIQENKALAAISYIWILFFIPMFAKKDSQFAQFHARQGLALFVLSIVIYFASMIPFLGWFVISWFGSLILLVFFIMGLINALSGKCAELPWIGRWFKDIKI